MIRTFFLVVFLTALSAPSMAQADVSEGSDNITPNKVSAATSIVNDVNEDGVVDALDVVDIVKYLRGSKRSVFKVSKADVNRDGVVDYDDAASLSKVIAGLEKPASSDPEEQEDPQGEATMTGGSLADPIAPNK